MITEISRTSITISKNEEATISWHNSILSVRTEKGIHLYEFSRNLQCYDKNIDLVCSHIPTSKTSPLTDLIPKELLKRGLNNIEYTQMILDPGLWPHNEFLVQEMTNVSDFQWSPVGMIHNHDCVLAILNNIGNITLYAQKRYSWDSILDFSEIIKQHYLSSDAIEFVKNFESLKAVADLLESSSISWGPILENHTCIFSTAQRNGHILFWLLVYNASEIEPEFLGEIQTGIGEIMKMVWIPTSDKRFLLICTNVFGQIYSLDCCLNDKVHLMNQNCLWSHKDKMISRHIAYTILDSNNLILYYNKHRHLLVQMIDTDCNVKAQSVTMVNDYRITDLKSTNSKVYLATVNCKVYEVNVNVTDGNLDVNMSAVESKESPPTNELYAIGFSNNNVIWALAMMDRKVKHRKEHTSIDIVFFTDLVNTSEMTILLENPSQKLTDYWDCISLLRYKAMKSKTIPFVDLEELYNDGQSNLYKLKLYMIFLIFTMNLAKVAKAMTTLLPETSIEAVRAKIMALHASQIISELFNTHQKSGKMLENLELETYMGAKRYLENYCLFKNNLLEFVSQKSLNLCVKYEEYTCQCCEEPVKGFSCENGHLNMFCSLTFTPIESDDYLICKGCGCTARIDLIDRNPMCLFCDLYLNNYHLPV